MEKLTGSFADLRNAGCIQAELPDGATPEIIAEKVLLLICLMEETHGSPCQQCPAFKNGKCTAYQQYHETAIRLRKERERTENAQKAPGCKKYPGMPLRQIAKAEGLSLNKTRELVRAGAL